VTHLKLKWSYSYKTKTGTGKNTRIWFRTWQFMTNKTILFTAPKQTVEQQHIAKWLYRAHLFFAVVPPLLHSSDINATAGNFKVELFLTQSMHNCYPQSTHTLVVMLAEFLTFDYMRGMHFAFRFLLFEALSFLTKNRKSCCWYKNFCLRPL